MSTQPCQQPSNAFREIAQFSRSHASATRLLYVATQDYSAARCLALNLLIPSLVMGAQAAEKFLKSYLLLVNPSRNVRGLNHSLSRLLDEVDSHAPSLGFSRYRPLLERFERHYGTRYPDNANASTSMTTADIRELDEFIILLNENLPCPFNVRYRSGLYAAITFSLQHGAVITPTERWIKEGNAALAPLLPRIAADYHAVMTALYPPIQL